VENKEKLTATTELSNRENLSSGPILVSLVTELLFDQSQQPGAKKSSIIRNVTLGSHGNRLKQLKILNDLLWKNSVSINSDEFDVASNDLQTLRYLLDNFLATCVKVESDPRFKELIENETLTSNVKSTIADEYLTPLKNLHRIYESIEVDLNVKRGEAWTLLGYLQTFIFGNMGYIDPVHKVALKLCYVDEDITDCEKTIYVATVYSKILGLTDNRHIHPRLHHLKESLTSLKTKRDSLSNLKAVRPANTEFIALSKEFNNFRITLGSYIIINKHVQQLTKATTTLKNEVC
jgi:hypothetical protein